jgi:hypothetical protein
MTGRLAQRAERAEARRATWREAKRAERAHGV